MNAMYSVEQVNVPPELGTIMKQFTKAVLRDRPENVYKYGANFFAVLSGKAAPFDGDGQLVEGSPSAPAGKHQPMVATASPPAAAAVSAAAPKVYQAAEQSHPVAADTHEEAAYAEGEEAEYRPEEEMVAQHPDEADAEADAAEEAVHGGAEDEMTDEDAVMAIFQKYSDGEEGVTSVDNLPELLADLREALGLSEDDLPPAEEIVGLLNCDDGSVDLLELKQLLFEGDDE